MRPSVLTRAVVPRALRRGRRTLLGGVLVAALSCGGPPAADPPAPPAERGQRTCPPPLVFAAGETRPVRIRLENRTADTLDVFIDRCWWHTWLASVPPGKYRQPELPEKLVTFPEGLRFHAFDMAEARRFGIYSVPLEARGVLTLVLDETGRASKDSLTIFALDGQRANRTVGAFAVMADGERGFAALQAEHGLGIVTFSCVDGEPSVGVSLPTQVAGGEVEVLVRRDGGPYQPLGRWRVQRGLNDTVVPPAGTVETFRRPLSGRAVVDFLVDDDGSRQVHRFRVEGLDAALAELGCWPASGAPGAGAGR